MICPECSEDMKGGSCINCGWKISKVTSVDPHHGKCAWRHKDGMRCPQLAVVGSDKLYCSWHYDCLTKHLDDDMPNGPNYAEWYTRTKKHYENNHKYSAVADGWDINDPWQIKGLALFGPASIAWKKAPQEMQEKARELLLAGWTPVDHKIPDLDDEERISIQCENNC